MRTIELMIMSNKILMLSFVLGILSCQKKPVTPQAASSPPPQYYNQDPNYINQTVYPTSTPYPTQTPVPTVDPNANSPFNKCFYIAIGTVCGPSGHVMNVEVIDQWGIDNRQAGINEKACKKRGKEIYDWCKSYGPGTTQIQMRFGNTGNLFYYPN